MDTTLVVATGGTAGALAIAAEAKKNRMLRPGPARKSVPNRYLFSLKSQLAF